MMQRATHLLCTLSLTLSLLILSAPAQAAPRQTVDMLPSETVLAIHAPNPGQILEALQQRTRAGKTILTQARFNRLIDFIKEAEPDDWKEMEEALGRYGLTYNDFMAAARGEMGYAIVMEKREGREPLFVGIGWITPGEELAGKFITAIQGVLEDHKDDADAPKRVDYKLEGHDVIHLMFDEGGRNVPDGFWSMPAEVRAGSFEDQNRFYEERSKAYDELPIEKNDQGNLMITRAGGKLLIVNTFPQSGEYVDNLKERNPDARIDFDEVTGVKSATAVFARLLNANRAGQEGGFTARMMQVPGLRDSLPQGQTMLELLVDPKPMIDALMAMEDMDEMAVRIMKALGVDTIGPVAFSQRLDGNFVRQSLFLSAPAPRRGLLTLLEQPEVAAQPPAWVPANVESFGHISIDLAKAYTTIKDIIVRELGPDAQGNVQMAEGMFMAQMGVDIAGMLRSLGNDHFVIQYAPRVIPKEKRENPWDSPIDQRMGMIWRLQNQQVWDRLFEMGRQMMGGAMDPNSPVKFGQEQGFDVIRIEEDMFKMGAFKGQGFMGVGIGDQVAMNLIAALRRGDAGTDALRGSATFERSRQLLNPRPVWIYTLADTNAYMNSMVELVFQMLREELGGIDLDGEEKAKFDKFKEEVVPSQEEMKNLFGVSVGYGYTDRTGFVSQSVSELAPAE